MGAATRDLELATVGQQHRPILSPVPGLSCLQRGAGGKRRTYRWKGDWWRRWGAYGVLEVKAHAGTEVPSPGLYRGTGKAVVLNPPTR
jgi:hypothetical protein